MTPAISSSQTCSLHENCEAGPPPPVATDARVELIPVGLVVTTGGSERNSQVVVVLGLQFTRPSSSAAAEALPEGSPCPQEVGEGDGPCRPRSKLLTGYIKATERHP